MQRARWLGLGEVLIDETLDIDIWSIRFEPKRRTGSESLWLDVATSGLASSSSRPGVTVEPAAPKPTLLTPLIARDAKLFTTGCGESFPGLSSPLVNNFGEAIRTGAVQDLAEFLAASLVAKRFGLSTLRSIATEDGR